MMTKKTITLIQLLACLSIIGIQHNVVVYAAAEEEPMMTPLNSLKNHAIATSTDAANDSSIDLLSDKNDPFPVANDERRRMTEDYSPPLVWNQVGSDLVGQQRSDSFGTAVATSRDGHTIAVGSPLNDARHGVNSGHTRVYRLGGDGEWSKLGFDIDGTAASDQSGARVAMSDDGNIVAVAAYNHASSRGQVRVFKYNPTSGFWDQRGNTLLGGTSNYYFGISLDMSGDGNKMVIGENHYGHRYYGRAIIVEYEESSNGSGFWREKAAFTGSAQYDYHGTSVAMNKAGTIVIIGSHNYVQVYKEYVAPNGNVSWPRMGNAFDTTLNYGRSVGMSEDGKRIVVQEKKYTLHDVFDYDEGRDEWDLTGQISFAYNANQKLDMSYDGKMVMIGINNQDCYDATFRLTGCGVVKFFTEPTNDDDMVEPPLWNEITNYEITGKETNDKAGSFVRFSENTIIIGNSGANYARGTAQVFTLGPPSPAPITNFCVDSPLILVQDRTDDVRRRILCSNVTPTECLANVQIKSHCPASCDECDQYALTDSKAKFLFGPGKTTCRKYLNKVFLDDRTRFLELCNKNENDFDTLWHTCRETCSLFFTEDKKVC